MKIDNSSDDSDSKLEYPSILVNIENANNENENQSFSFNIESLFTNHHYLCYKCKKFPFIEFCKDYKTIKYTCSCRTNEKKLIKDLLDDENNTYLIMEKNFSSIIKLLSSTNTTLDNIENYNTKIINCEGFICPNHNSKFKYFCTTCLDNICEECYKNNHYEHNIIKFEDFEKDNEERIRKIKEKLNKKQGIIKRINNSKYIQVDFEELEKFHELINIIISDYKEFPNFSHLLNIENIFHFYIFEINNISENKICNINVNKNSAIFAEAEYNNNFSGEIKIFGKKFVKNNKRNIYLEIEGKKIEIKEKYKCISKDDKIKIKIIIKNNINEINMYKMFSNCRDLISLNGISNWKKIKLINMSKMFYNCIFLEKLPDINKWNMSETEN